MKRIEIFALNKFLSLVIAPVFACACVLSSGCDMGTYNQRLKEKPAAAPVENAADSEANGDSDVEAGEDSSPN